MSRAPTDSRVARRGWEMRHTVALTLALCALVLIVLVRPTPVIRWLARRQPDILFRQETEQRLVALTIDDSPDPTWTPQILDTLAEHDAHATFFLIGERVVGNEEILKRIVDEGHELGNHLMADAPSIRLSAAEFERQLRQTHAVLAPYGPVRWFRPGSGWYSRRMIDQIQRNGYQCALGSAFAFDCHIRSVWYVSRHILLNTRPGAVIVLHDGAANGRRTVTVLGHVLPVLRRRGYRGVTLSELTEANKAHPFAQTPITRSL